MKKAWMVCICIAIVFLYGCIASVCLADRSYNIIVLPEDEVSDTIKPRRESSDKGTTDSNKIKLSGYDPVDKVYQYVYMGEFEQTRGGQPILWRVLTVEGNDALLLSEYVLSTQSFGKRNDWERSDIKDWLNSSFVKKAFSSQERKAIYESASLGQVFIPSQSELSNEDYGFNPNKEELDEQRCAKGTRLAVDEGLFVSDQNECSTYYTRTVATKKSLATVTSRGTFGVATPNRKDIGVRPAIWINLEKISFTEGEGTIQDPFR